MACAKFTKYVTYTVIFVPSALLHDCIRSRLRLSASMSIHSPVFMSAVGGGGGIAESLYSFQCKLNTQIYKCNVAK